MICDCRPQVSSLQARIVPAVGQALPGQAVLQRDLHRRASTGAVEEGIHSHSVLAHQRVVGLCQN